MAFWDHDHVEMLKASYREVTGRQMPSYMTPDQVAAELHRLMPVISTKTGNLSEKSLTEMSPEDAIVALCVIKAAAKLTIFVARHRKARLLRDKLEMLEASYHEVTGHSIPTHMTPDQAEAELKRLCPPIITANLESTQDVARVLRAALKLKSQLLKIRRRLREEASEAAAARQRSIEQGGDGGAVAKNGGAKLYYSCVIALPDPSKQQLTGRAVELSAAEQAAKVEEAEQHRLLKGQISARALGQGEVFRPASAEEKVMGKKLFEGWMVKRYNSWFKTDHKRWFVLYEKGEMCYYDSSGGGCLGSIQLQGVKPSQIYIKMAKETTLTIKGARDEKGVIKDWNLDAEAVATCTAWKSAVASILANSNAVTSV